MNAETTLQTYDRIAEAYARDRDRTLFERAWLDRALAHAPHRDGGRTALDLGCGTGLPIASYLFDRRTHVTGVDGAAAMLALFRANLPRAEAIEADMRSLALDRQFDLVLAWDSFFHLSADDQRAMFAVFAAHAAPRGALMFTSGTMAGEAWGRAGGADVYHASLDGAEYKALLADNGFTLLDHVAEDPACAGHTVWLARYTG